MEYTNATRFVLWHELARSSGALRGGTPQDAPRGQNYTRKEVVIMTEEKKVYVNDYRVDGMVGMVHDRQRFNPYTGGANAVQTVYLDIKALKAYIAKHDGKSTIALDMLVSKKGRKYAKMSAFGTIS